MEPKARFELLTGEKSVAALGPASIGKSRRLHDASGFTLLEIVMVLFLLTGMLSLVIPKLSIGQNLGSVGRKWVGSLKTLQDLSMTTQKTVRLYVDIDRGMYWPMVLDGNEEKTPQDPIWAYPLSLPETVRFSDIQVGATRKETGRVDIFFYPNGRIDQATVHLTDSNNNVMGIFVEPVTALIRVTDHRIDPPKPLAILERIRPLLQPITPGLRPASVMGPPK